MCLQGMHTSGSVPVGASACDPNVSLVDVFLHLSALYVITTEGKSGEALAPASPATNRSIIQPCLFCADYQHLFPNLIRQTL